MTRSIPRVYNIAPGGNFLEVFAKEVLLGFPFDGENRKALPLHLWTILLPTRRASRSLADSFAKQSGKKALLLPKIQPIGDIDLADFGDNSSNSGISEAISRTGYLLMLLDLLKDWAAQNPQVLIANEIAMSSVKSLALATSLLELVEQMEVEETNLDALADAYLSDLSEHRNSILSLLGLLKVELPRKLYEEKRIGPAARRSLLIRLEAHRIATARLKGPIIAAGSTGTIPATRQLLKTIAHHPQGAVILPGLDQYMSDEDWEIIGSDHPQFTLRTLVSALELERQDIKVLGQPNTARNYLSSEMMRPSASTEKWHTLLPPMTRDFNLALDKLCILAARDRHIEARSIALILRNALEIPGQTAALVTPDRDLAKRVKTELLRWNISIEDSAGEPLINHGLASLAALTLDAISNGIKSSDILGLLSHVDCTMGMTREKFLHQLRNFEIVVLRGYSNDIGPAGWKQGFMRALEAKHANSRAHSLIGILGVEDWQSLEHFIDNLTDIFSTFFTQVDKGNSECLSGFRTLLKQLAPEADWSKPENHILEKTLEQLAQDAFRLKSSSSKEWFEILLQMLREQKLQTYEFSHPRLAMYGVLEARLLPADILILGGLNEGTWPAQPNPGPWLNRSMRSTFQMQQPERDIGVSAHDFVQALGYKTVYITWSQRLLGSPQIPSRWILRLQAVLAAVGLKQPLQNGSYWLDMAQAIDASETLTPFNKPQPKPPITTRPLQFSVTEVEKLIRDPYAIYAKKILKIEPLPALSREPGAALRGTLFHNALKIWNQQQPIHMLDNSLRILLVAGEEVFSSLKDDPEIRSFWWPRFKTIAAWMVSQEFEFRKNAQTVSAELEGHLSFSIEGVHHRLTARADRIDILKNSRARILDYKSGQPPTAKEVISGMSPQLSLEAAILAGGGFKGIDSSGAEEFIYVHITGSNPPGDLIYIDPTPKISLDELAQKHLNGFRNLLTKYQRATQAYFPRVALQKEEQPSDYDHLSRHLEWMLAGDQ
jgi:ATP-dependent helicase/nuclease subunit B